MCLAFHIDGDLLFQLRVPPVVVDLFLALRVRGFAPRHVAVHDLVGRLFFALRDLRVAWAAVHGSATLDTHTQRERERDQGGKHTGKTVRRLCMCYTRASLV